MSQFLPASRLKSHRSTSMNDADSESSPSRFSFRWLAARARTLAVVYFVLLATATHWPDDIDASIANNDKLYHFGAYAVLAVCVLAGAEFTLGRLQPKHFFAVWLAGTVYGAIDEVTQPYFRRDCDVGDWFADVLGVVVGLSAYVLLRRLIRGRPTAAASPPAQ